MEDAPSTGPRAPRAAADEAWLRRPTMPPGAGLRLTTVIGSGALTAEVFEILRDLMVENDKNGGEDLAAGGGCPNLQTCGTKSGGCPSLTDCGHYTAVAIEREPDT